MKTLRKSLRFGAELFARRTLWWGSNVFLFFVRLSASAVTFLMLTELQRPQQLFLVPPSAVRLFFRGPTKFSLLSSQNFLGAK